MKEKTELDEVSKGGELYSSPTVLETRETSR